ncbi:MAG: pantetheine-phosphate adenylyltransferase [Salibacteraceae bacterium]
MKIAVFPGSFDPFTLGHQSIVEKAIPLFDRVIIGIGVNSTKSFYFDLDQRVSLIEKTFSDHTNVDVLDFSGLTVDFCSKNNAKFIIRGLRNPQDYQYESAIAQMNQSLNAEITSVFFVCDPVYAAINSSIVREIHKNGGDISQFLPHPIALK